MTNLSYEQFKRLAKRHNVVPLFQETLVDRETPVSVYERLRHGEPHSFLLESVEGGERFGRYSFVGQRPYAVFMSKERHVTYRQGSRERTWTTTNPVQDLKTIMAKLSAATVSGLPRFWGGAVGYWDYDTVRFFERLPDAKKDMLGFPSGAFQLTSELVMFDRLSQSAKVIANVVLPEKDRSESALRRAYRKAVNSIARQIQRLHDSRDVPREKRPGVPGKPRPLSPRNQYLAGVKRAKEHIRAGNIIQVVLSQRWEIKPNASPFQVYRALRTVNPSPYMYLLHFPELDVVGSSPELLVRKEGTLAETRPIAGTRRRGESEVQDRALADELRQDPKEKAEHLMLVDLGRNDLGRVCQPGSVRVPTLMTIENYSHVMHLVSEVTGELRTDANAFDLFEACFPAGTVSGAPKIRAMQIIDEVEATRRGPYAGSVGYFSYTGNMDMAITIRTLFFRKGVAIMQAGAGIVADSVPEMEYRECEQKAAALFSAVAKAREFL